MIMSIVASILIASSQVGSAFAGRLDDALATIQVGDLVPGADRYGAAAGAPLVSTAYRGDDRVGFVFLNTDVVGAIGYSGKPIHLLIAIDPTGTITGLKLYEHSEPIVLIGIPEARVVEFIDGYIGRNVREFAQVNQDQGRTLDIISGATVTIMVIDDAITRSVLKVARALGIGDLGSATSEVAALPSGHVDMDLFGVEDWITLTGDGSVRRLGLTVGEVTEAFAQADKDKAASRPESDNPDDVFADFYVAQVSVPTIGRSLLGEAEYDLLAARLKPDQQAVLIVGNGLYSFKGSGYVRGGIFDRVQLIQGENSIRFRDRDHKRLGRVEAEYAQAFREVGLFVLPEEADFDPVAPWRLELLVHRAIGALEKDFLTYDLRYTLPERYIVRDAAPIVAEVDVAAVATEAEIGERAALWQRIWRDKMLDVGVLAVALVILTIIFFFQDWFARRPTLATGVRVAFLVFTVAWIGGYAQAQLSVVNVLTFGGALITGFKWDYFLMDPLIFILWVGVAGSLLFWGRGPFCGWLCPFGALQELLNKAAKMLKVPQFELPWGLHVRMWPVKYVIFLALFGLSLYSFEFAEKMAEVEPFKTSVILRFARGWPFVLYAGALLAIGLFVERFFCRYLCPLGAALAIPGKMRIFEWLLRYKECGSPCHRCAKECMVQAIHPDGHINPNECLYCLHCQQLYYDDHKCPAMIQRRLKRERREAMASPSMTVGGGPRAIAAAPEVRLNIPAD
jgi:NosR/NirI family nitrous oxide reductase transcriptional regulator